LVHVEFSTRLEEFLARNGNCENGVARGGEGGQCSGNRRQFQGLTFFIKTFVDSEKTQKE